MKDNRPGVPGGNDITWSDFNFCQRMYPRPGGELMPAPAVRAPAVRAVVSINPGCWLVSCQPFTWSTGRSHHQIVL
jgi:hypothetical protein